MKKLISTLLLFSIALFVNNVSAQACAGGSGPSVCNHGGGPINGGFEDPNTTPCITQGATYNHAIQFRMYTTFMFGTTPVGVDSIKFIQIDSLPCGLCWATNKSSNLFVKDEQGCLNISGTSNDAAGQYKLALTMDAWVGGSPTAVRVEPYLADSAGVKIFLRVKTAAGSCPNVSPTGTNVHPNPLNCANGIDLLNSNISSLNIIPNPMNSNGVVYFVSSKTMVCTIRISDITGKVVSLKEVEVKQGPNSIFIEKNELSAGIYFLSLTDGKSTTTNRFSVTE